MLTVIETPLFSKLWPAYWSEDERGAFAAFIAEHPDLGELVLLFMYAKSKIDSLKASTLKELRDAVK